MHNFKICIENTFGQYDNKIVFKCVRDNTSTASVLDTAPVAGSAVRSL